MPTWFNWNIETYRATYNVVRSSNRSPQSYSYIEMRTEPFQAGVDARVLVYCGTGSSQTGTVRIPSFNGYDLDYVYYLFLPADQFDTLREFLDSERPIQFGAYHDGSPWGSTQNVLLWSLNTPSDEIVGEEETESTFLRPFKMLPEELITDDVRETLDGIDADFGTEESGSESAAA